MQNIRGKGVQLFDGLHQLLEDGVGIGKTRAVPRMPRPSARQAMTRTISAGAERLL